ncbi:MAG: hypothetical protein JXR05_08600 [Flavobacteriaceae bacterium]
MSAILGLQTDIVAPFRKIWNNMVDSIPAVLGFIAFVIVSWIVIKVFLWLVKKALSKTKIDEWSKKLNETEIFGNTTINIVLTKVILGVLKWFLILIFVMVGSEMYGVKVVSEGITGFIAYLPKLLTALGIFVAGVYVGTLVKKAVNSLFKSLEITGGNLVGNIAFYLIVVFLSITAFDQAGIDTSIIKSNLTLVIGSVLLAFAIAFGLGSRDIIKRLLFGYYSRKNLEIGQKIRIKDVEGVVESIDNICFVVVTAEEKIVYPIKDIVDSQITILK